MSFQEWLKESSLLAGVRRGVLWYFGVLAGIGVLAAFFTFLALAFGFEQSRIGAFVFFGIAALFIASFLFLKFPLDELFKFVTPKKVETAWRERSELTKTRIGQLAFILLVFLLVPFVDHPQYLVMLALALVVVSTLSGWRQTLAGVFIATITAIALWPMLTKGYNDHVVPAWEWLTRAEENDDSKEDEKAKKVSAVPVSAMPETVLRLTRRNYASPVLSLAGGTCTPMYTAYSNGTGSLGWDSLTAPIEFYLNGRGPFPADPEGIGFIRSHLRRGEYVRQLRVCNPGEGPVNVRIVATFGVTSE